MVPSLRAAPWGVKAPVAESEVKVEPSGFRPLLGSRGACGRAGATETKLEVQPSLRASLEAGSRAGVRFGGNRLCFTP